MKMPRFLLVPAALMAGCVALAPIDPVLEERVTELQDRTFEVLRDGDAGRLSLEESRRFLHESEVRVQALHARAVQNRRHPEELAALEQIGRCYAVLLAQKQPLRSAGARELWAALTRLRLAVAGTRSINERIVADQASSAADAPASPDQCPAPSRDAHKRHGGGNRDGGRGRR